MAKFQIFTDSCSDLPTHIRQELGIEYCHMNCVINGEEIQADLDWKLYSPEEFYGWMRQGKHMKTTAVPYEEFVKCLTPYLEKGYDCLYIACSHKCTGSMNTYNLVREELLEQFPDRRIVGVDSLNASACEGVIVMDAATLQKEGKSLDEVVEYIEKNRNKYNQFATVDDLTYIKNAGRIKGSKAALGNFFHKKPIFISDAIGNNYTLGTVTATKNADKALLEGIVKRIDKDAPNCRVVIYQAMAQDRAARLKEAIKQELNIDADIWWLGPIIGTTCGPGTLAVMCFGKEVTIYEGDGKPTPLDYSTLG